MNEQDLIHQSLQQNEQQTAEKTQPVETQAATPQKQKLFSRPFSFKGRICRLEYILSYILAFLLSYLLRQMVEIYDIENGDVLFYAYLILLIIIWWFSLAQGFKRCHDNGNPGYYLLIPFWPIFMFCADGDPCENDYGPDPKGRDFYADTYADEE